MNLENFLHELPRFRASDDFKCNLKNRLDERRVLGNNKNVSRPAFFPAFNMPRFAFAFASIVILFFALFLVGQKGIPNVFKPKIVYAADVIKRNVADFFKPNTIYHQRTKQYINDGDPTTYELWQDMDNDSFKNHSIYPESLGGYENWQVYDLNVRWNIDVKNRLVTQENIQYNDPGQKYVKRGTQVDLASKFNDLVEKGQLELTEGKLGGKDVYIIKDTRTSYDKVWDLLYFDKDSFRLLRTEITTTANAGTDAGKQSKQVVDYEIQESLEKNSQIARDTFTILPISIEGFNVNQKLVDVDTSIQVELVPSVTPGPTVTPAQR